MGAWGYELLQSDSALDVVSSAVGLVLETVDRLAKARPGASDPRGGGETRKLPEDAFSPTTTISTQIVMDMQNARPGTTGSNVLFAMSLVLLVVAVVVVLGTRWLTREARTT